MYKAFITTKLLHRNGGITWYNQKNGGRNNNIFWISPKQRNLIYLNCLKIWLWIWDNSLVPSHSHTALFENVVSPTRMDQWFILNFPISTAMSRVIFRYTRYTPIFRHIHDILPSNPEGPTGIDQSLLYVCLLGNQMAPTWGFFPHLPGEGC